MEHHSHLVQASNEEDTDSRVEFSTALLNRLNDTLFLENICGQAQLVSRQIDMSTGIIQLNRLMKIITLKSTVLDLLNYITVGRNLFKGL